MVVGGGQGCWEDRMAADAAENAKPPTAATLNADLLRGYTARKI